MHDAWKRHPKAVYWIDINLALRKGLKFLRNGETSDTNDNVKTKINTKHTEPDNDVTHLMNA